MTAFKFRKNSKDKSDQIPLKDSDSSINVFEDKLKKNIGNLSRVLNYGGRKQIIYNCT